MKSFKEIKIKELILHNFGLKILAIIIAIVSWIVIVNVDNPSQRKTCLLYTSPSPRDTR